MPERKVTVPGRGHFLFPSSMTDDEIEGIFKREFPEWYTKPDPKAGADRKALRLNQPLEESAPAEKPEQSEGMILDTFRDAQEAKRNFVRNRVVTQEEANNMPESAFADVERIKRKDGDDLLWNASSGSFRRKSVIDTDNRRKDLIPEVMAQLPKELDDVAQRATEPFKGTEHIPAQARNAAQVRTKAKARYLMAQLDDLGAKIDAEESRLLKARQMDGGGEIAFDEWDVRGYGSLIEEYNFRREALGNLFREERDRVSVEPWTLGKGKEPGMMYHVRKAAPGLFGDPDALEGEPYHRGIAGAIPAALHATGKVSRLGVITTAETIQGFQTGDWTDVGRNLRAYQENPDGPLPFDKDLESLSFGNDDEFWTKAAGTVAGAGAEMVPFLGAFSAARALGVGAFGAPAMAGRTGLAVESAAGAAIMGFNEDGSPNPMGMAMGIGLPIAGKLGGMAGGRAADKYLVGQWEKTMPVLNRLRTSKGFEYPWLSPGGKAMTANGISRAQFLRDSSALLRGRWQTGGALTANTLYLAALQTPGVLDSDNPEEAAWEAVFNYLPWVLYGLKPAKMPKGVAPQTIEALRKVGFRNPLVEIEGMVPRSRARLTTEGVEPGVGTSRIYRDPFPEGALASEPGGRSPLIRWRAEKQARPADPDPLTGLPETGYRRTPVPRGPRGAEGTLVPPGEAPRGLPYTPPRQPVPIPPRGLPSDEVITPPAPAEALPLPPYSDYFAAYERSRQPGSTRDDLLDMAKWMDHVTLAKAFSDKSPEEVEALLKKWYEQNSSNKPSPEGQYPRDTYKHRGFERRLRERGYPITGNMKLSTKADVIAERQLEMDKVASSLPGVKAWLQEMQASGRNLKTGQGDVENALHQTIEDFKQQFPTVLAGYPDIAKWLSGGKEGIADFETWASKRGVDLTQEQPPAEPPAPVEAGLGELGDRLMQAYEGNDFEAIDAIRQEVHERGGDDADFEALEGKVLDVLEGVEAPPPESPPEVTGPPAGVVVGGEAPLLGLQKGKSIDAKYALVPMNQLEASHKGEGYSKNEAFAPLRNTRDYAKSQTEKEKVLKAANEFDPQLYAQLAKGAETGPIMVSQGSDGVLRVMGGNGRFQAISRLSDEQRRDLRDAGNMLREEFGLPENTSTDQLLIRLLPPHDVSTKEGIEAANEIIDILNPSAGLIESAESMAIADAATLSADEVLRVIGQGKLKEQQQELKVLIGHGRLDTNTRTRVTDKVSETADYVRALKIAAAYGPENGALLADFARLAIGQTNIGSTYTAAIESPAMALLDLRTRGHAAISDAFSKLMAQVVDLKNANPRDGLLKQLDAVWEQGDIFENNDSKIAKALAFAARQQLRKPLKDGGAMTAQDRIAANKVPAVLEGVWEKVRNVVYGSAIAGEGMLFEGLSVHQGLMDAFKADYGYMESESAGYVPRKSPRTALGKVGVFDGGSGWLFPDGKFLYLGMGSGVHEAGIEKWAKANRKKNPIAKKILDSVSKTDFGISSKHGLDAGLMRVYEHGGFGKEIYLEGGLNNSRRQVVESWARDNDYSVFLNTPNSDITRTLYNPASVFESEVAAYRFDTGIDGRPAGTGELKVFNSLTGGDGWLFRDGTFLHLGRSHSHESGIVQWAKNVAGKAGVRTTNANARKILLAAKEGGARARAFDFAARVVRENRTGKTSLWVDADNLTSAQRRAAKDWGIESGVEVTHSQGNRNTLLYDPASAFESEVARIEPGGADPRVLRLNDLYRRLKLHEANQLKKATADRKPVPQKLSDEILEIEAALGQEFMGFFKETKLREEELAKKKAEHDALKDDFRKTDKPTLPITDIQQGFMFNEPGAQMGLFESEGAAGMLPWEDMTKLRGLKAADPFTLREGTEVEAIFDTDGLSDWMDANNLTEAEISGLGQVIHFRREAGEMQMTVEFDGGTPVVLEYRGHDPVDPGQLKLIVHQRGAIKNHERILGPKEAKAEGIQKVLELGDKRPLPPPPERAMIRAREDLVPKRTNPDWLRKVTEAPAHLKAKGVVGVHEAKKFPLLRPHQRDSANRAIDEMQEGGGHFLLASGTGSGKTMTELAVASHFAEQFPDEYVLMLTENRAIMHTAFAKDAEMMGIDIYEFGGKPPEADKKIYMGTYKDVQMGKVKLNEFKTIILDEAHNMRNMLLKGKGQTAKGTDRLLKGADRVMYATATPMDKPEQIYAFRRLFDVSPERALLKVGLEFGQGGGVNVVKGFTQEQVEEGLESIWEQVYEIGRGIKDEVPLDNTEVFYRNVKLTPRDVKHISDRFHELEVYYNNTAAEPTAAGLERMKKNMGRKFLERVKMKYSIEEAKAHIRDGKKVIMFAYRAAGEESVGDKEETLAAYQMQLEQEGIAVARLFGAMTNGEKQGQVAKFQEGHAKIALATPGSGGTGISLDDVWGDAPRVTMLVTPPYSALEFIQMIGRGSRLTTQSKSQVVVPMTNHWVDRWNVDIIIRKLNNLRAAVKGDVKAPKGVRDAVSQLESEVAKYVVPEEKIPHKVLEAQKRAGEQAAVLGAFYDSVASKGARDEVRRIQSTGAGLHTANLIASLDFDHSQVGVAYLTGKKVRHLSEVAAAFTLTRSPFAEGLKITAVDASGTVISDDWIGYGTPKNTPSFDVQKVASHYKDMGATHVILTHNESNGQEVATHSPQDQAMIDKMNLIVPTIGLVTDHGKFAVLEAGKQARYEELPKEAQGEFFGYKTSEGVPEGLMGRQLSRRDPNTGSLMLSPDMVAMAMHEATGGKNFAHSLGVALLGPQGHLKSMIEFGDPSLLSTPQGVNHLRKIARANGSVTAVGVYNGEPLYNSKHYETFSALTKSGVLTDVLGYEGEMPASMANRAPQQGDLGNHIMGVPRDSWNEFQSEAAEYDPSGVPNQTGLEYNIKDRNSGKVTKVPVPLGGMKHVKPLKMVWAVKLFESLMGKRPKAVKIGQRSRMGKTLGYFKTVPTDVFIDVGQFKNEAEAAKTLWHEIGHWTDWMDEGTLARGNVIGRLKSLKNFLRKQFGELNDKELREELKGVTDYWHPWDRSTASKEFIKYRDSAVELYADALSMLFNDPALLQKMAPNFYAGFFKHLDSKPKLSRELIDLWETLDHDYIGQVEKLIEQSLEEYAEADAIIKMRATEARERRKYWKSWYDYISYGLNYKHAKFERKLKEAKKAGYDPTVETDPKVLVEESLMVADNRNTTFLKKTFEVVAELEAAGIEQDILGKWMELERVIFERSSLANPGGVTPLAAKEQMIVLRNQLGAKKSGLIENWALPRLHDLFFEIAEEAMHEGIINSKTFKNVIEPNRRYYVPFAVTKYLMATMPATVKHQIGTFEKIGNPFTAWVMKAVAMQNFIGVQKAKRTVRDFLTEQFGEESIKKAPVKKFEIPKNRRHPDAYPFREEAIKDPDWGIVSIFENGRPVHYYVDPLIADGFNEGTPRDVQSVTGWISQVFQGYLYPIFITYNAGFHAFNLLRDFGRSRRTLRLPRRKMLMEYKKALGPAIDRLKGIDNPLISEMMDNMAFGPLSKKHDQHHEESSTSASQLAEYGLIEPEPLTAIQSLELTKIGKALANVGDLFEALPKIATYQYLKEYTKKTPREESFVVRNYSGTPNTRRRGQGALFSSAKALIPFWNVFKEGMKADYELASGTVSHVGSAPHGKSRGTGGKSKSYREWGWEKAKTAGGWWWAYAKVHGIYAALQGLAAGGFLGEEYEDLYDGISEYDKTNYMVIPLGKYSGGDYGERVGYMRVPRDFASQFISGLVYKTMRQFGDNPQKFHEAIGYTVEQGPARNPIITIPFAWKDYVAGRNPEDGFRDRPILNRTEEELRGVAGAKKMLHWTANQVGARDYFNFFMPDDEEPVGGVMGALTTVPVMNRFFKVSDSGYREQQWAKLNEKQRAQLIQRERHEENVKDALGQFYTLGRLKTIGLTPAQELRLLDLSDWHRNTYTPMNDDIESFEEFGSKKEAQKLRKALSELTEVLVEPK